MKIHSLACGLQWTRKTKPWHPLRFDRERFQARKNDAGDGLGKCVVTCNCLAK